MTANNPAAQSNLRIRVAGPPEYRAEDTAQTTRNLNAILLATLVLLGIRVLARTRPERALLEGAARLGAPKLLITVTQFVYRYLFVLFEQALLDLRSHTLDARVLLRQPSGTAGIEVSLFLDPDARQIALAKELQADAVELHTGCYALAKAGRLRDLLRHDQSRAREREADGLRHIRHAVGRILPTT